jgi:3-oxoadipate enol-lactonase
MPVARVNGIELNYKLEGDGPETIVLINGLADDLETWLLQMDDLLDAGFRVLRFDNRGIGSSSKPAGPYSSRMLADDAKALADQLGLAGFHLMGISMGGMIAQEYALAYPGDLRTVTFACTYAAPGPFCSRMFAMWGDLAPALGVPFVMRDVTLWAFTVPFFEQRGAELAEFETAMRYMDQPVHAYLAARRDPGPRHEGPARPGHHSGARAGRGGGHPHPRRAVTPAARGDPRLGMGDDQGRPRLRVGAPGRVQPDLPRLRTAA